MANIPGQIVSALLAPGPAARGCSIVAPSPPSQARCALSIRGLTVERARRLVLEDVAFTAQPGVVTAVLGEAGSGKTSLLAAIAGLIKPMRGAVLVGCADVTRMRPSRRGIVMLPPGTALRTDLPIAASIMRPWGMRYGRAGAGAAAMRQVDLEDAACVRLREATHGQGFAALAAARAAPDARVLLVDEAGIGLSRQGRDALMGWLRARAAAGCTVLIATRCEEMALGADQLILLRRGCVLQAGEPCAVYAAPRDEAAAVLTGRANILRGMVRQKLPGGFVWVEAGARFAQADHPSQVSPALGAPVALCLRLAQLTIGDGAANRITGVVEGTICRGDRTELCCATALGPLRALGTGASGYRPGMKVELGWGAEAAFVLAG